MKLHIQVKDNVTKMLNNLNDDLTIMAKGSGNSIPSKIVRWGKWKAISLAPHSSGATKRAIQIIDGARGEAKLRLRQPNQPTLKHPVNYHLWMHGVGRYDISEHIKSGDPKFMFTTAKLMEKQAIKLINRKLKKYTK